MYDFFLFDCGCVRIEVKLLINVSKVKFFGAVFDYINFFV